MAERIFGGKGSYEKYLLVERRDLDLKVKESKQQYLLELEVIFLPPLHYSNSPPLFINFWNKLF